MFAACRESLPSTTSLTRPLHPHPTPTGTLSLYAKRAHNSAGGVVLLGLDNRIAVDNTLDSRVDLAFEQLKPKIRELLFGKRPAPVREPYKPAQHH
jgi:vacuolar-type H+-ATPase subunit E/Vma4